jgi:hypothetical protein
MLFAKPQRIRTFSMLNMLMTNLSQVRTIWSTFLATLVLTVTFGVVMHLWQFQIIDEMFVAEDISAHIAAMSLEQRSVHAWLTGTVDVAYPFAYAAFFIGVVIKSFDRKWMWLALPSILVVPADLVEGFAQVMLLNGHETFMPIKVIATPVKLALFLSGLAITISGLVMMLKNRLQNRT